jgi:hypothetical protein
LNKDQSGINMSVEGMLCSIHSLTLNEWIEKSNIYKYDTINIPDKHLGDLLIDFLEVNFNDINEFIKFFNTYGFGGLRDVSISKSAYEMLTIDNQYKSISANNYDTFISNTWLESKQTLIDTQSAFNDLVYFCLDIDRFTALDFTPTTQHRFYVARTAYATHLAQLEKYKTNNLKVSINCDTSIDPFSHFAISRDLVVDYSMMLSATKNDYPSTFKVYSSDNIINILYIQFTELVLSNTYIRKCGNCDRYFILSSRKDKLYCDRLDSLSNRPCYLLASEEKYKNILKDNPIEDAFRKAAKRYNLQCNKNQEANGKELYARWVALANELKKSVKSGLIPQEQYFNWLDDTTRKRQKKGDK